MTFNRNILITGGAGFIGTNLIFYLLNSCSRDRLVVLDALTYAGNLENIKSLIDSGRISFVHTDLSDIKYLESIIRDYNITHVMHLAAESHVDRSVTSPIDFINSNITGTFNLLEAFRANWERSDLNTNWRFLHVSTDEVFGSLNSSESPFIETSPYQPNSPYAATKASSDHIVRAWHETYNLPVLITNCSNNYGPFQFPEKLIPLTINNILLGKVIPLYGNGKNIRDWLYVEDHCSALELILNSGVVGSRYCIGGNNEMQNYQIIKEICEIMDDKFETLHTKPSINLVKFVKDRPGHDFRYAINSEKLINELGWIPKVNIRQGLEKTVSWYTSNYDWINNITSIDFTKYISNQYGGIL